MFLFLNNASNLTGGDGKYIRSMRVLRRRPGEYKILCNCLRRSFLAPSICISDLSRAKFITSAARPSLAVENPY